MTCTIPHRSSGALLNPMSSVWVVVPSALSHFVVSFVSAQHITRLSWTFVLDLINFLDEDRKFLGRRELRQSSTELKPNPSVNVVREPMKSGMIK